MGFRRTKIREWSDNTTQYNVLIVLQYNGGFLYKSSSFYMFASDMYFFLYFTY